MQRDYGGDNAYKCISRITSTRTLQTVGRYCQKTTHRDIRGVRLAHLLIRQQRRLTLARETLGELLASRVVLEKVEVMVHVPVRRGGVALEVGRVRVPGRRVHDVLVHREVVAPPVPVSVPQLATVRPPRRLGLLQRGQRKARIPPFLWGSRERV